MTRTACSGYQRETIGCHRHRSEEENVRRAAPADKIHRRPGGTFVPLTATIASQPKIGAGKNLSRHPWAAIASSEGTDLNDRGRGVLFSEGANVDPKGAVFQPELIELMKSVLDDATASLPEPKRTSAIQAEMASTILACAAKGERNPQALKMCALTAVDIPHYSHVIAPERRAV
jgi:hypothetical protein